ncbi:MAG: ATP-binding protein [Chitinophagaceae bacterium]
MKLSIRILLGFSIVLLLSVIDTFSNYVLSLKVEENTRFLGRSQEIIRNSGRLHKEIIEMQSAYRGYLLTKDSVFLIAYNRKLENIPAMFVTQQQLVNNNPEQSNIMDSIRALYYQWLGYTTLSIAGPARNLPEGENGNDFRLQERWQTKSGERLNEKITRSFNSFDKYEYTIRGNHAVNLAASIHKAHVFSLTFFTLTIVIGIACTVVVITSITRRINSLVELAEAISKGNFATVTDRRSDEMTRLSVSLNSMSESLDRNIGELEKRNAELDKFAYVVSHDLKAPLRGIHNVVKWIEEDHSHELSPQLVKYLEIIGQRTGRMESLINGLLAYARTREKMTAEKTDVGEIIRELKGSVVPPAITVICDNLPVFYTERIKLEQVFTNLFTNAVKHIAVQGGKIRVTCTGFPRYYEFAVSDNGRGIDPQYHEKIFELFQTLREKGEKESTGLGLAIIKKIIEDVGGSIEVHSALGEGATFRFTWPVKQ